MKKILLLIVLLLSLVLFFSDKEHNSELVSNIKSNQCEEGEIYNNNFKSCFKEINCNEVNCTLIDEELANMAEAYILNGLGELDTESIIPLSYRENRVNDLVEAIFPKYHYEMIENITEESDGPEEILASVVPINNKGSKWELSYDPVDAFNENGEYLNLIDLLATLTHEYGHILSLNHTQVKHIPTEIEYIECQENEKIIDEGCAKFDSYITQFMYTFWSEAEREEAFQALLNGTDADYAYEQFNNFPEGFITEYAATNAVEDFAESFTFFILQDQPIPTTVYEEKINFFYQFPELSQLRNHIRYNLHSILQESF